MNPEWQICAPCAQADPEIFFPTTKVTLRQARSVCKSCPFKAPCALWAIRHNVRYGIWGGLGRNGRDALAAELNIQIEEAA